MKKPLLLLPLVAALFTMSLPAQGADYHIVVPVPGKAAPYAAIKLELNSATLPLGRVNNAYAGFDFNAALRITGDPELDMSQVVWSVSSGSLPAGLSLTRDGSLYGTPNEKGEFSIQLRSKYKTKAALGTYQIAVRNEKHLVNTAGVHSWEDGVVAQSCQDYRQPPYPYVYAGDTGDGLYRIAPNDQAPFAAYCDMTSDGGGWTRVALQYEATPVFWTGATNGASYSLAQNKIPAHTHTGFGKDSLATYVDYIQFKYTTNDIPVTTVTSPKSGITYHIFRSKTSWYGYHDPELDYVTDPAFGPEWHNTLSIDQVGISASMHWAYSPGYPDPAQRGVGLGGVALHESNDSFGWSVWVR